MLRLGLVGTGDAGAHHARAISSALESSTKEGKTSGIAWTAICARDVARVAEFRATHGVPASVVTHASYDALLESRACDAVILATPDGAHASQVEAAAARGLHVLVEKPLALTREDGARAIAAARKANVHIAVGYHLRHHGAHRVARARLAELVGTLRTIHVRWAWPDPATNGWRARRENAKFWSLAALGTHAIDLAMMFGGAPTTRVAAVREPATGADRAAEVSFALSSGALAHVSVSVLHRAISRVVLSGDTGELEAVGTLGARGDGALAFRSARRGAELEPVAFDAQNPYEAQLLAFADAIADRPCFTDVPTLLANLDVLDDIAGKETT
jgi:predicted dehydrogenase